MRHLLIALAVILGISIVTASSKRTEGVEIEKIENVAKVSEDNSLSAAMKKASTAMRRLSRAVGSNDWVKIDMWTQELKNLIGFSCVELYMIENNNIPDEFKELSNKFNSAINKLILCG
ncbi:MAG: hypothetical protein ACC651_14945, partial [Candidatus Scalindua sp.]